MILNYSGTTVMSWFMSSSLHHSGTCAAFAARAKARWCAAGEAPAALVPPVDAEVATAINKLWAVNGWLKDGLGMLSSG